uniref:Uncharacterized protein n=1 Tax=Pycnococcus provasolii TaxID=41880 RepID=A0A7S2B749_9CHLO|mmetsp:Transcript_6652/g.15092  ORF Transcript_6652/g.15092 Transcript_6652/m.15092 type:complete len:267 (+) Transcript_6652:170-970(+)
MVVPHISLRHATAAATCGMMMARTMRRHAHHHRHRATKRMQQCHSSSRKNGVHRPDSIDSFECTSYGKITTARVRNLAVRAPIALVMTHVLNVKTSLIWDDSIVEVKDFHHEEQPHHDGDDHHFHDEMTKICDNLEFEKTMQPLISGKPGWVTISVDRAYCPVDASHGSIVPASHETLRNTSPSVVVVRKWGDVVLPNGKLCEFHAEETIEFASDLDNPWITNVNWSVRCPLISLPRCAQAVASWIFERRVAGAFQSLRYSLEQES